MRKHYLALGIALCWIVVGCGEASNGAQAQSTETKKEAAVQEDGSSELLELKAKLEAVESENQKLKEEAVKASEKKEEEARKEERKQKRKEKYQALRIRYLDEKEAIANKRTLPRDLFPSGKKAKKKEDDPFGVGDVDDWFDDDGGNEPEPGSFEDAHRQATEGLRQYMQGGSEADEKLIETFGRYEYSHHEATRPSLEGLEGFQYSADPDSKTRELIECLHNPKLSKEERGKRSFSFFKKLSAQQGHFVRESYLRELHKLECGVETVHNSLFNGRLDVEVFCKTLNRMNTWQCKMIQLIYREWVGRDIGSDIVTVTDEDEPLLRAFLLSYLDGFDARLRSEELHKELHWYSLQYSMKERLEKLGELVKGYERTLHDELKETRGEDKYRVFRLVLDGISKEQGKEISRAHEQMVAGLKETEEAIPPSLRRRIEICLPPTASAEILELLFGRSEATGKWDSDVITYALKDQWSIYVKAREVCFPVNTGQKEEARKRFFSMNERERIVLAFVFRWLYGDGPLDRFLKMME